ncbi:MAG: HNH endonuclease [Oscillospiraceae bacterium]|nr:HNH endonuclease [Oscillospiraceae bacterium]
MKNLSIPLKNILAEKIFEECVSGYRDKGKVDNLLQCKEIICRDSNLYDELVPKELEKFEKSLLPANITKEKIINVYNEKFVKGPGRKYYNEIKKQAIRNICPICGIRQVKTLDHYLPKSQFPTLSVTPNNLIPACLECNVDKKDDVSLDSKNVPVHLYFDNIPDDKFLHVTVMDNLEILYYISCPNVEDEGLKARLEKHLDFYKLHELYSSHAASEIADKIHMWKIALEEFGEDILRLSIDSECRSAEMNDINSWKSALYRGLVNNFDKLLAYLQL